ncbi:MAG: 4Fe-4S dicluster domain-containing protein [Sphingomonadaceae bacterium]|nr:4Fe-4S dicluster domain-containing protein [Sphingomonadaceae bacterium]
MPIHEKSLIRPENLSDPRENLVIDGVDVSGDWSTFIRSRVVKDYNENLQDEIAALPGGEYIHRCWQCGSCTNSCTVNAENPEFNPRYWIYLIRMGMEAELLRDKDIIWQCVSCNKCTSVCPRDVVPEGIMKATAHWLEMKGYTEPSKAMVFDEIFTEQIIERGRIEDGEVLQEFLKKTNQPLMQDWLIQMVKQMVKGFPLITLAKMGLATIFKPKTSDWARASAAIKEHIAEEKAEQHRALGLDPAE